MSEYYVRSTGGSDGNTGLTFAQGWATLVYAYSNSSTNDTIYICSTEAIPFSLLSGMVVAASRLYIGCDLTDGSPYNGAGKAYIRGDALFTTLVQGTAGGSTLWQDIVFDCNKKVSNSFFLSGGSNVSDLVFRGCDFKNGKSVGVYVHSSSVPATMPYGSIGFHSCNFYDNTYGMYAYGGSNYLPPMQFDNCAFYGNSISNCYFWYDAHVVMFNCRIFRSGGNGIDWIWGT